VLRLVDGRHSVRSIAEKLAAETGSVVDPARLAELIARSLVPAGLVHLGVEVPGDAVAPPRATRPGRWVLIPAEQVPGYARPLVPLLSPPAGAVLLATAIVVHALFWTRALPPLLAGRFLLDPEWIVAFALSIASFLLHELGHAAALLGCGETPGDIGVARRGPSLRFFADVSRAWMLPRGGRLRVDLGGVRIQFLLAALLMVLHAATGWSLAARTALLLDLAVLFNLGPWPRLDGSWVLADLTGEGDPWSRLRARARGQSDPPPLPGRLRLLLGLATMVHASTLVALAAWLAARAAAEWRGGS
jgi:putative peptide zinc metalloprotease protein